MNIIKDLYWKEFFINYLNDNLYWYIPKGYAIKSDNFESIKNKLSVLKEYENKIWNNELQTIIRKEFIKKGLFEPRAENQNEEDENAIIRVIKVITSTLGLAWVNEKEKLHITDIGNKLLEKSNYEEIIFNQIRRFEFNNFNITRSKENIKVLPIFYLANVLIKLKDKRLTKDEYCLFIAKKSDNNEIKKSVDEIERYRLLSDKDKDKIKDYLRAKNIKNIRNKKRKSILNTIELDSSYAFNFFVSSNLFYIENSNIFIKDKKQLENFLNDCKNSSIWIDFKEKKDWFYYYGSDNKNISPIEFALDYYTDISDVDNALYIYNYCKKNKIKIDKSINAISETEFKSVLVDEKILEDFLERHIKELEKGLRLIRRQYPTISGPIDLLAIDNKGRMVVIELKKNRVSDKVIGQVARYVSFLEREQDKEVRAIIIGKKIDNNIKLAVNALSCRTDLYNFDYRVNFERVN